MSKPVLAELFTFSGRRDRRSFILNRLLGWFVLVVVWTTIMMLLDSSSRVADLGTDGPIVFGILVTLVFIVSGWAVCAQRARDLGWPGSTILLTYIPLFGLLFYLYLLFQHGIEGDTEYGSDPL